MLNKRLKIFLNYFVGPALFVWLSYSIYQEVRQQGDLRESWHFIKASFTGPQWWKFMLVFFFMLLNWAIEAKKWQFLMKTVQEVSFIKAYRAIFVGLAFAFSLPNRAGESAGRAVYLDEGNRLRGITLSVVGSISQIIVTLVGGLTALLYLHFFVPGAALQPEWMSDYWLNGLIILLVIGTLLLLLLYFRLSWCVRFLKRIPLVARYRFLVEKLENFHWAILIKVLGLSAIRYGVFVVQYMLLLQVFEVQIAPLPAIAMTAVLFLTLTVLPTIAMAELGFRGKVSIQLFGLLSSNAIGIIATAAGIWVINLIIPAITGTLFILGIRLFSNK